MNSDPNYSVVATLHTGGMAEHGAQGGAEERRLLSRSRGGAHSCFHQLSYGYVATRFKVQGWVWSFRAKDLEV
jgi:hypothetical protein